MRLVPLGRVSVVSACGPYSYCGRGGSGPSCSGLCFCCASGRGGGGPLWRCRLVRGTLCYNTATAAARAQPGQAGTAGSLFAQAHLGGVEE